MRIMARPSKYADARASGLTVTITGPELTT
jgi:hypothetical protein